MQLPAGYTETQVLAIIENIVDSLACKYRMPGLDRDELAQEIRVFCLEALPRYDGSKGSLDALLYQHCRNRLLNLMRDRVRRHDAPCKECAMGRPCWDGKFCARFEQWQRRNRRKQDLAGALPLDNTAERVDAYDHGDADIKDVLRLIDRELDPELRADLLRMRSGVNVPNSRRQEVEQAVQAILERAGVL